MKMQIMGFEPITLDSEISYSNHYTKRICVDIGCLSDGVNPVLIRAFSMRVDSNLKPLTF